MSYRICLIPGDGIGPEIADVSRKVLDAVGEKHGFSLSYEEALLGGIAIDECGTPLPDETLKIAKSSDAVLLAAVGGPKWDNTDPDAPRPEQGLLGLRKELGLYANLRPVKVFSSLLGASTLKREHVEGVDLVLVRELTGGLYFGERGRENEVEGAGPDGVNGAQAYDSLVYSEREIERIVRYAFELAMKRRRRVHSVDKANVLATSRLWREVTHRVAYDYPDVELIDLLVDNAAMQLVSDPRQFDVIVTENMFGDILSDEASMLSGSLGMLASASLGDATPVFEPSHGSAPDIAGKDIANPLAQVMSAEMMLRFALDATEAADDIASSINAVLDEGWRTADLADEFTPDDRVVGTKAMGDLLVEHI